MEPVYSGLGRCVCCFWLAVVFDILGLAVLLIGLFVNVFFYDLLIYAGAIVIFLSLIWWVFWYSGNIEVPPAELEDDVGLLKKDKSGMRGISSAVRRLSGRMSSGIRNTFRRNDGPSSSRTARSHQSGGLPVVSPLEHGSVAMATLTLQEPTSHTTSGTGFVVEMQLSTTETSPT